VVVRPICGARAVVCRTAVGCLPYVASFKASRDSTLAALAPPSTVNARLTRSTAFGRKQAGPAWVNADLQGGRHTAVRQTRK
jgi:hypothetical protein